jgi:hypothetical protein
MSYFVACCISRDNRIHTEWLMHVIDGAMLLHLGDRACTKPQRSWPMVLLANIFVDVTTNEAQWPGASRRRSELQ